MNKAKPVSVGIRIRLLRRQQQRLLRDVAGQCGFTVSLLSKIEAGKTSPPVATLAKIAASLGVSLSQLFGESDDRSAIFVPARGAGSAPLTRTEKGYAFRQIAPGRGGSAMQPFIFVAERGGVKPGRMTHAGEEFVHVLSGRMRYRVGRTTYALSPGDSLYFDSAEEHDLEPVTRKVTFLAVFTSATVRGPAGSDQRRKKEKR